MSGVHHAEGMTCRAIGIVEAVIAFSAKINRIECGFIMALKHVAHLHGEDERRLGQQSRMWMGWSLGFSVIEPLVRHTLQQHLALL
jgi:hypothetical protein